jgi:hypothetical protein
MAIRVLKSVPSAQSVVNKHIRVIRAIRVQINFRVINGNSCSKYTVNLCAKSILCSNKNGGWDIPVAVSVA